ncbi:MAG: hypothetical protein J7K84_03995 [Deltaproteobacteria bacterium]|nr:hypothetical protein [Deltaproteobacteria bacterium]
MLINQNSIAILKKDALQKLRIIFCITMAVIFCFASQVGADEKTDIKGTIDVDPMSRTYSMLF